MQSYGNYFGKMWQKLQIRPKDMQKLFEEISLHYRNMDVFHQFCGIVGSIFSNTGVIMGHKFEPNGTSPSKTWLS